MYVCVFAVGVNYRYDEELVVPIVENTPHECDLKVRFVHCIVQPRSVVVMDGLFYSTTLKSRCVILKKWPCVVYICIYNKSFDCPFAEMCPSSVLQ